MSKCLTAKVRALYQMQAGECFYCGRSTWLATGEESTARIKSRLQLSTRKQLSLRQATGEHLQRRAEGGKNDIINLVLACYECNQSRGNTPVLLHLANKRTQHAQIA